MSGPVRVTADSAIFTSGKPVRLYAAAITSGGGGAGDVVFKDGTSTSGTAFVQGTGTTSKTVLVPDIPACGLLFPNGLFVDVGNNTDAVVVWAELVSNA